MKILQEAIRKNAFLLDVEAWDLASLFRQTLDVAVARELLPPDVRDDVEQALLARERQQSTAIGHAVAVPHAYLPSLIEPLVLIVRLERPINLGAPDGIPTRFFFLLLGPTDATAVHLDTLATIARSMSDDELRYELGVASDRQELLNALERFQRRTAVPAAAEAVTAEGLQYTGRLGGGLIRDIRRRLPHYVDDWLSGFNTKCIASILFLFFACLAPAVTFGGVMAIQTDGHIGAVEMILASAVCGIAYAIFSGQPLIILGGTGPLLIFTAILYRLCQSMGLPFLPTYAWIGLWTAALLVLLAVTDASYLMRYFTRFTDEIFAALISLIFIYEAIRALVEIFHDLDVRMHHDTALLSLLLALGTLYIATSLSGFRRSRYLLPKAREFLADFGPTLALVFMTLTSVWLHEVDLDVLPAPESFGTTLGRPWLVDLFAVPMWVRVAALGPALLGAVLMYLDQNITARLVNAADHKLHKGTAYHLDLAVVGGLTAFCSMLGLPWLIAATVRSLNHVRSLADVEEVVTTGGGRRDRIIHVRENRVTGASIHAMIGMSLLLLPWLKVIPMAVLYGLFLYMGIVSMKGNQFFERLSLWAMDKQLYPSAHYIRRVPNRVVHMFTLLQLVCLIVLWVVKTSSLGILFPLFIALLVPIRMLASRFFDPQHLEALDAEEVPEG